MDSTGEHGRHWTKQVPNFVWAMVLAMFGYSMNATFNQFFNDQMDTQVERRHLITQEVLEDQLEPIVEKQETTERIVKEIRQVVTENQRVLGKPQDGAHGQ